MFSKSYEIKNNKILLLFAINKNKIKNSDRFVVLYNGIALSRCYSENENVVYYLFNPEKGTHLFSFSEDISDFKIVSG